MNTSDVLNRIRHHRISQEPLIELLKTEDPKLHDLVRGCGSWLHVREWLHSGETRLRNANFCGKFLLCRCCAARRAAKLVAAYANKVAIVQAAHPGLIPAMITLTIKNRFDLGEGFDHIKGSWSRMMVAKRAGASNKKRDKAIEWNKVLGSVRAIEVTNEEKGQGWHPHIHAFVLLEDYIDQKTLSAEWERFTGDSFVVGITKCKNGVVGGLIETLKYCSKLTELSPAHILEVHRAGKGSRFADAQGILRGVPEPDIRQDNDEGLEGPYRDFFAVWCRINKGFRFKTLGERMMSHHDPRPLVYHRKPESSPATVSAYAEIDTDLTPA